MGLKEVRAAAGDDSSAQEREGFLLKGQRVNV